MLIITYQPIHCRLTGTMIFAHLFYSPTFLPSSAHMIDDVKIGGYARDGWYRGDTEGVQR